MSGTYPETEMQAVLPWVSYYQEKLARQEPLDQGDAVRIRTMVVLVPRLWQYLMRSAETDEAQRWGEYKEGLPGVLAAAADAAGVSLDRVLRGYYRCLQEITDGGLAYTCEPPELAADIDLAWFHYGRALPPDPDQEYEPHPDEHMEWEVAVSTVFRNDTKDWEPESYWKKNDRSAVAPWLAKMLLHVPHFRMSFGHLAACDRVNAASAKERQRRIMYERALPEAPLADSADDDVPWSKPEPPKNWADMFNCSERTFKRRVENGTIHARKLSSKAYQVDKRQIPKTRN